MHQTGTTGHVLNSADKCEFKRHRTRLAKSEGDWRKKAEILREIRDRRLFREEWRTFEGFCRCELEMGKTNVNRLLQCAEVAAFLATKVAAPKREAHVRPLLRLRNNHARAAAFQRALNIAEKAGKNLTGALINRTVKDAIEKPVPEVSTGPTKAAVMTRICRSIASGLEEFDVLQLERLETALASFKAEWLRVQSTHADTQGGKELPS